MAILVRVLVGGVVVVTFQDFTSIDIDMELQGALFLVAISP